MEWLQRSQKCLDCRGAIKPRAANLSTRYGWNVPRRCEQFSAMYSAENSIICFGFKSEDVCHVIILVDQISLCADYDHLITGFVSCGL